MKKKALKKLFAVTLAASMVCSLAACGGKSDDNAANNNADNSTTSSSNTNAATDNNTSTDNATAPAETTQRGKETVTFMTIDFNAGTSNTGEYADQILNQLNEAANVDLQIEWILTDVLEEKITLAMSSPQTMPMVITHSGMLTGNIVSAAKQGAFVDLNDYIWDSEKYPNLSQMNKDVADTLTVDGKLIAIPRTRDIGRYGLSYRKDWAEAVGITSDPKTIDDVYDMLYKFTYEDPDGNGKDDTYGLEMTLYTGPFDIIQTWFGVGNGWAEVDGKLVPVHMQPEYQEALDWIKKVYDDGLMPKDWAVRTTDTWENGCKTGESGVFIDTMDGGRRIWDYFGKEESYTPSVTNPDEQASMRLLGAINDRTLATSGYNGYFTVSASTCDTPEKVDAVLTLLDKLNDNDLRILVEYGIEGVNWEKDADGNLVDLDLENPTLAANYMGLNQLLAYLPRYTPDPAPAMNESRQAQEDAYVANEKYAVLNPATSYLANSATYADIGATLDEELKQARTQYICGEIDQAGLQAAWDSWLSKGGQAIIDEVNEQYLANQ